MSAHPLILQGLNHLILPGVGAETWEQKVNDLHKVSDLHGMENLHAVNSSGEDKTMAQNGLK